MPTVSRTAPAVLAAALLLTACGNQSASSGSDEDGGGPVKAEALCPSDFSRYGSPPSSEPSVRPSGTRTALPLPSAGGDGTAGNGVEITALYAWGPQSGCTGVGYSADFEITNQQTHTATYTLTFGFLSASGGAVDNVEHTVEAIAPGRAVKGTVVMGEGIEHAPEVTGVKVIKVRSVPEVEGSSASGACPESGMHLYADEGNAAMGLRAVGLHLVNCGTRPIRLNGYPKLVIQDEDHHPVDGVRILQGTDRISTGLGGDSDPQLVVLRPGEAAAATLAWRNTTQAGAPVNAPYVRVWATPAADPVTVVPELDLGTTGKLGVGPWQKDETYRDPAAATTARP